MERRKKENTWVSGVHAKGYILIVQFYEDRFQNRNIITKTAATPNANQIAVTVTKRNPKRSCKTQQEYH
jgi:hypothetical protein